MDVILTKLSEIEDAANRILDRTTIQKKNLSDELKERTEAYDRELEAKESQYIEEERESLQRQREEKLVSIRSSMQEQISQMDDKFLRNHTEMAKKIMQQILEA